MSKKPSLTGGGEKKITAFCIQNDLIGAYAKGEWAGVGSGAQAKWKDDARVMITKTRKGRIKL